MRRIILFFSAAAVLVGIGSVADLRWRQQAVSDHEADFDAPMAEEPELTPDQQYLAELRAWKRPDGPPRVALQAGHWKAMEAPEELAGLRRNGAVGGGFKEWEVNLAIAQKAAALLEQRGVTVDILATTIPPDYGADAFVSIHADSHTDPDVSGFKAAAPRRDMTGKAQELSDLLEARYAEATDLPRDPNVTSNMRGYYAFNWRRYEHSLHPMTPAAILETGFLTSPHDRRVIVARQDKSAQAVADAVTDFLEGQGLLYHEERSP